MQAQLHAAQYADATWTAHQRPPPSRPALTERRINLLDGNGGSHRTAEKSHPGSSLATTGVALAMSAGGDRACVPSHANGGGQRGRRRHPRRLERLAEELAQERAAHAALRAAHEDALRANELLEAELASLHSSFYCASSSSGGGATHGMSAADCGCSSDGDDDGEWGVASLMREVEAIRAFYASAHHRAAGLAAVTTDMKSRVALLEREVRERDAVIESLRDDGDSEGDDSVDGYSRSRSVNGTSATGVAWEGQGERVAYVDALERQVAALQEKLRGVTALSHPATQPGRVGIGADDEEEHGERENHRPCPDALLNGQAREDPTGACARNAVPPSSPYLATTGDGKADGDVDGWVRSADGGFSTEEDLLSHCTLVMGKCETCERLKQTCLRYKSLYTKSQHENTELRGTNAELLARLSSVIDGGNDSS